MIFLCLTAQGAIQRRSLDDIAEGQVRRGQIRRRSLNEVCGLNPAGCLAGPVYIHPGIQGGPGQIGIPDSDWPRIGDAVDAVGARRSEDAPLGYSCLTNWFQADFQEAANFYWLLTSARSPRWLRWKAEFLLADDPGWVVGPATRDAEFSLVEDPGCFCLRRRGRNLLGSLREVSCGGVFSWFSEGAGKVKSPWYRVGGGRGSCTQFRYLSHGGRVISPPRKTTRRSWRVRKYWRESEARRKMPSDGSNHQIAARMECRKRFWPGRAMCFRVRNARRGRLFGVERPLAVSLYSSTGFDRF